MKRINIRKFSNNKIKQACKTSKGLLSILQKLYKVEYKALGLICFGLGQIFIVLLHFCLC